MQQACYCHNTLIGKIYARHATNITQLVDADKMVFDDFTVDWCATSIFKMIMDLDSISKLDLFQRGNDISR